MGDCGELCARETGSRARSRTPTPPSPTGARARAQAEGKFKGEIVAVEVPQRKGPPAGGGRRRVAGQGRSRQARASLRPAFQKEGTITAGNASSLSDGAAGLVLAGADVAEKLGGKPSARIVGAPGHAQDPQWFTTAPAGAIERLLAKVGLEGRRRRSVGAERGLRGGGPGEQQDAGPGSEAGERCGAGPSPSVTPSAPAGARVLVTLLAALADTGGKRGVASLCIGGGEGIAWRSSAMTVIERLGSWGGPDGPRHRPGGGGRRLRGHHRRRHRRRSADKGRAGGGPPSSTSWWRRGRWPAPSATPSRSRSGRTPGSAISADVDFVVEAASESPAVKQQIFSDPRSCLPARGDPLDQHLVDQHHRAVGAHQAAPTASSACTS
jgi:hypothetical protein